MVQRVDEWTSSEDKKLVDIIINFARIGKKQLDAFDEAGTNLKRTPAACAFRWHKTLSGEFQEQFNEAKWEHQQTKKLRNYRKKKETEIDVVKTESIQVKVNNVDVNDLVVKEFEGQRVLTFRDIDEVHGRPEGTASRNFLAHKDRFIEGEDYYNLSNQNNEIRGLEIPNRGLIVVSESGYLMLVKSFTDDLAWEVQRKLVKTYFKAKEIASNIIHSYMISDPVERAKAWIREQEEKQKIETEKLLLEQQVADVIPKITYLDTILDSKDSVIVSQISEDYGISAKALNKILHEEGIQYKRNDQWLLYSDHKGKGYTESRTIPFVKPNGEQGTSLQTRWTQKGRLFIHNVLTNKGINPLMDRE